MNLLQKNRFRYFLANLNRQQQYIQSEEDRQDEVAISMGTTTKSLFNTAQLLHYIVKDDRKVCLFVFSSSIFFSYLETNRSGNISRYKYS
jgi:hypothetical protein